MKDGGVMDEKLKSNLMSESLWLRILYMVVFYLVSQVVIMLVAVLAVVQALFGLITGKPNLNLQEFSIGLNRYLYQILCFLTFNRDEKPYPFTDWPKADHTETAVEQHRDK